MIKSVMYLVFQARTKDMENIKELMQGKAIELIICTTQGQVGDIFTISLSRSKFEMFRDMFYVIVKRMNNQASMLGSNVHTFVLRLRISYYSIFYVALMMGPT